MHFLHAVGVLRLAWENLQYMGLTLLGLVGLIVLFHLLERTVGKVIAHRLGWRGMLLTGWLGVPVHELSHLVMAILFRHRILAWKLFDPDPVSGTLGYVRHAYRKQSPWQNLGNFLIAVAPFVSGTAFLAGILTWMLHEKGLLSLMKTLRESSLLHLQRVPVGSAFNLLDGCPPKELPLTGACDALCQLAGGTLWLLKTIWRRRTRWFPLQSYLGICIASHMTPSFADLAGCARSSVYLIVIFLLTAAGLACFRFSLAGVENWLHLGLIPLLAGGIFLGAYASLITALFWLKKNGGDGSL